MTDQLAERLKNMTPLQRAIFALKETQARLDALEQSRNEPIAVVGMACRFPGRANDTASYWRLLCDGVDAIREIPPERWNVDEFYDPDPAAPGKMSTRWGGFLERIEEFDNHFFGISDREAARIDPQQRMLLELAWEALEDAGLPPEGLRGTKAGVFIGISLSDYGMMLSGDVTQTDAHSATGTSLCLAANRVSFAFGFQGPSIALDTACSSSLVAVHLACQQIRSGECEMALAGGCSLLLSPIGTINLTKAGFCSSDGKVRSFDAAASGYVRGEGAGLVVLRPLSAALRDNDPIYAVIRGSAVNQNGSSNGLTAPSRAAQEQVLREAYARAKVAPGDVQFVETQGTGTPLGDAIEAAALGNVLREGRPAGSPCALGAVKTNIGHLEAASGIASLMKAALALKHRQLPPNLHFQTPNPDIAFDALRLAVQRRLEPWKNASHPRFAGVSAFGFGGSNAHVVLEEPPVSHDSLPSPSGRGAGGEGRGGNPSQSSSSHANSPHPDPLPKGEGTAIYLLPLSARTDNALNDLARRYVEFLRGDPPAWPDVCYTAARRRQHHDCRLAVLAKSHQQAADLLDGFLNGGSTTTPLSRSGRRAGGEGVFAGRKPFGRALKIAFLYDDRAENWEYYGPRLASAVPGFVPMTAGDCTSSNNASREAILALQLALTVWWRRVGITPDVVLGKGLGELAAAAAAGILTSEDALQLAAAIARGDDALLPDGARPRAAVLPFYSALDGKLHPGTDLDSAHWRACVNCSDGLAAAMDGIRARQVDVCLEIGPGVGLEKFIVPSLLPSESAQLDVLTAIGTLYAAGGDVLWDLPAPDGRCVRLPTYPWQRQRLWLEGIKRPGAQGSTRAANDTPKAAAEPIVAREVRSRSELSVPYVAARTSLEAALAGEWSTVLGIDRVGIHDNFLELGGDSLQATILLNRLQEDLGQSVPGHMLFHAQTIKDLADYLRHNYSTAVRHSHPDEPLADGEPQAAGLPPTHGGTGGAGDGTIPAAVELSLIPRLSRDQQAEQLLGRLDQLSDDEVASLLGEAAGNGEDRNE